MGTLGRRVTYRGGFSVRYFMAYQWRDTIVSWCLISAMFTITGLRVPLAHSVTIHLQSDFIRVRQWLPLPITQSIHSGFWSPTRANGVGSSARTTTKKERLHHLPAVNICPSYVQPNASQLTLHRNRERLAYMHTDEIIGFAGRGKDRCRTKLVVWQCWSHVAHSMIPTSRTSLSLSKSGHRGRVIGSQSSCQLKPGSERR